MSGRSRLLLTLVVCLFPVGAHCVAIDLNAPRAALLQDDGISPCGPGIECPRESNTIIDFEADEPGPKANGLSSAGNNEVTFSDTLGEDLIVSDFGVFGRSLAVLGKDASALRMDLAVATPINWLSIAYNVDPSGPLPADEPSYAYVQLYLRDELLAEVVERAFIDENPAIQAGFCCDPFTTFDNARFVLTDAVDDFGTLTPTEPLPLIEIVDSIEYGWRVQGGGGDGDGNGGSPLPEPGSPGLFGLVLAGLAASRWRNQQRRLTTRRVGRLQPWCRFGSTPAVRDRLSPATSGH
jgi:hypothetical protein